MFKYHITLFFFIILFYHVFAYKNEHSFVELNANSHPFLLENKDFFIQDKQHFLRENEDLYGYDGAIDNIVEQNLKRFKGSVYLDYTGAGVYQDSQIDRVATELKSTGFGNSHSRSPTASNTDNRIEQLRKYVFRFFSVPSRDYDVIFTSGTTGCLKMVGEWFPWSKDSYFIYLKQNHNSLLGIREYAVKKGKFRVVKEKHVPKIVEKYTTDTNRNAYHLFAYPAEENFSGGIYPLSWITKIKQQSMQNNANWKVLLDAAAFVPTNPLNVTKYPADAICISFYKMFGYPTGLGAAIIRRDLLEVFKKTFFGGGTVSLTDCNTRYCKFVEGPSKFEDGTLHFLGITAAIHGFKILDQLGMDEVQAHVYSLTRLLYNRLSELKHSNGQPVVRIYGKHHIQHGLQQGGIVSFNLLSSKGYYRRLFKVQSLAAKHNINIRTGCHCNPGACYDYVGLKMSEIKKLAKKKNFCSDSYDMVNRMPLGSIRASLGYLTTYEDVVAFVEFIKKYFVE